MITATNHLLLSLSQFIFLPQSYFAWEPQSSMSAAKVQAKSLKALFVFLNEYGICPTYFSKSTAFLLFNYLVELKNLNQQFACSESVRTIFGFKDYGEQFTFQRFLLYIIRSSLICYDNRIDHSKYPCSSHIEKLNLLLERMEISDGFANIQKKTHTTNNSRTSLLIPSSLITKVYLQMQLDIL